MPALPAFQVISVNTGAAAPLRVAGGRTLLSGIRKTPAPGRVAVRALGLAGDEQADLSVHGGLQKAVYAYPVEHLVFWRAQRLAAGVSLFDEALPPGMLGENLSIQGLLEHEVWIGDVLQFPHCTLRVTAPREPCGKLNTVLGFDQAARLMVRQARCGFYLAVDTPGTLCAGESFTLRPGTRALSVVEAIRAKWAKHRN